MEKGLRFKHFEAHTDTEKRLVVARSRRWWGGGAEMGEGGQGYQLPVIQ